MILKPMRNGVALTLEEIDALTGKELDVMVAICFFGRPEKPVNPYLCPQCGGKTRWRQGMGFDNERICVDYHTYDPSEIKGVVGEPKAYSTDIAAAFEINPDGWTWSLATFDNRCSVLATCGPTSWAMVELDRKPTPSDCAKVRCLAALKLASKIGQEK